MGERGPVGRSSDVAERLGKPSHGPRAAAVTVLPGGRLPLPGPPQGLSEGAAVIWCEVREGSPWLTGADRAAVLELTRLCDDLVVYRAAVREHGPLLTEVIADPRGGVIGTRMVANPAVAMVLKTESAIGALRTSLGLSPQSRARLGLTLLEGERRASKVEELQERARLRSARSVS